MRLFEIKFDKINIKMNPIYTIRIHFYISFTHPQQ